MIWAALLVLGQDVPRLAQRVEDRAGLLSPFQVRRLSGLLEDLERTDSTQVVLLTIPSTAPRSIEQFANETARANGIGQKGKNNGVLLVVAVRERKVRIEVGYGLEHVLTDALCSIIIQREMVPRFRNQDYTGGIVAGTDAVIGAVKGTYTAPEGDGITPAAFILLYGAFAVVMLLMAYGLYRRARHGAGRSWTGGTYGYTSSSWGGGGSDGGGSSFSGGGGDFGGGGASGSW